MHLQRRRETHGSVNQAGTLPAPFPIGRRPRRPGNKCQSQRLPRFPSQLQRAQGSQGQGSRGPGGRACRTTRWEQSQGGWRNRPAGHSQTVKLMPALCIFLDI